MEAIQAYAVADIETLSRVFAPWQYVGGNEQFPDRQAGDAATAVIIDSELNLARAYNGWDQFTRELMRVAGMFEEWACMHVAFDHMEDTWSYYLDIYFGIYGIDEDGFVEHIADRDSYGLARELVLKLVPGADCAERVVGLCPRC